MSAATQNLTISNSFSIGANQTWDVASEKTLTFGFSSNSVMDLGGYSVTKSGSGTLALPGSGGLTLQNGTLTLNRGSTTTTNVSGGYKITATNTFNLIVNSGASFSTGASAGSYEWNANTTISGGTVTLGNTSGGGTFGGTFTLSDGGRLNLGGTTGSVTISNAIQIAGGTSTLAISNSSQYNTTKLNGGIKGNGTLNISSGKDITISGIQDQSGALAINMTSGTLTFGGTNNYSGGTTLSGGTLNISGSLTGGGDFIIKNGTTANFNQGSTVTINTGNSLVVGQETSGTSGRTLNANGTVINAGTLNVGRNGILNLNEGVNWTQTGEFNIKGNGGYGATANLNAGIITYTGTSTIHLNAIDGSNASGSSTLNISGGTLATSQGFTFTTGTSSTSAQGKVIFSNGGTLQLGANVSTITNGTGTFQMGTGGGIIDTNGYDGTIAHNITGAGSLTKAGDGTLTLSGTNTYSGGTIVDGGILNVTGSIIGSITVNGGTVQGNSNITLTSGADFLFDLSGNTAAIDISGILNLNGAELVIVGTATDPSTPINIATFDSYTGSLTNGSTVTSADSGQTFSINYDTNNITLTLVPEPSTYAFGAIGVLGALVLIRRRRTK